MKKTALLVIDVQRGLFDDTPRPFEADAVVERINSLTSRARAAGVPVVFIQHEEDEGPLVHGTTGWQLQQQLDVQAADTKLRKAACDSFLRTPLQELLGGWGTEALVVCGYASEYCVDTTVRRAAGLGYPVTLVADAHTTHDAAHASGEQIRAHHNATLRNIGSLGPAITTVPAAQVRFGA